MSQLDAELEGLERQAESLQSQLQSLEHELGTNPHPNWQQQSAIFGVISRKMGALREQMGRSAGLEHWCCFPNQAFSNPDMIAELLRTRVLPDMEERQRAVAATALSMASSSSSVPPQSAPLAPAAAANPARTGADGEDDAAAATAAAADKAWAAQVAKRGHLELADHVKKHDEFCDMLESDFKDAAKRLGLLPSANQQRSQS